MPEANNMVILKTFATHYQISSLFLSIYCPAPLIPFIPELEFIVPLFLSEEKCCLYFPNFLSPFS